jgi:o-succinylbenzoate synthase
MQHIKTIHWFPYKIPFRTTFTTAHGTLIKREGAIVEIVTEYNLSGIGEIAPLPEFAGDDLPTALAPLPGLSSQLCGKDLLAALTSLYTMGHKLPATTLCGLESALLDVLGKCTGRSVHEILVGVLNLAPTGGEPEKLAGYSGYGHEGAKSAGTLNLAPTEMAFKKRVPVNVVIGAMSTEDAIIRAHEAVYAGYSCIKLKVGNDDPETEIMRIAAVRNAIGPDIHLRLDANEAWTFAEAMRILSRCTPYNVQYVEQPLPASNLDEMRTLRYNVPVPIAADEAVYDLESARRVLAHEAAQVLILKPQLAGGLRAGRQILTEATQHGVQCVITSTIETGVGITGALHLAAASPEVTLECGLATLHLLADDLLIDHLTLDAGFLAVPMGSGLGVQLDRNALLTVQPIEKIL